MIKRIKGLSRGERMRMIDTDNIIEEYVATYNKYMTLPDDSEELEPLNKRIKDLENTLTRRFLFENGYVLQKVGEYSIFVKENVNIE